MEPLNLLATIGSLGGKFLNTPTTTPTDDSLGMSDVATDPLGASDQDPSPSPLEQMYYKLVPPGTRRDGMISDILDNQRFHEQVDSLMSRPISYRPNDVLCGEASLLAVDQLQLEFESQIEGKFWLYSQEGIDALDELVCRASTSPSCSVCDKGFSSRDYDDVVPLTVHASCISNFPSKKLLRGHLKDPRLIDSDMGYALIRLFDKAHALEVKTTGSNTCNIGPSRRFVSFQFSILQLRYFINLTALFCLQFQIDCRNIIKQSLVVAHVLHQRSHSGTLPSFGDLHAKLLVLYKMKAATASLICRLLTSSPDLASYASNSNFVNTGSGALNAGSAQNGSGSVHDGSVQGVSGSVHIGAKHFYHAPVFYGHPPAPINADTKPSESRCCAGLTSPFSPRQSLLDDGSTQLRDMGGDSTLKSTKAALPAKSPLTQSDATEQTARYRSIQTTPLSQGSVRTPVDLSVSTLELQDSVDHKDVPEFPLIGPLAIMLTVNNGKKWQKLTSSGWESHGSGNLLCNVQAHCNVQARVDVGESARLAIFREGLQQKPIARFDLMEKDFKIKLKKVAKVPSNGPRSNSYLQIRSSSKVYRLTAEDPTLLGQIEKGVDLAVQRMADLETKRSMEAMMAGDDISVEDLE